MVTVCFEARLRNDRSWPHAAIGKRVPIAAVDRRSRETVGVGSGRARGCQSERKRLAA